MIKTLTKVLIAAASACLVVMACDTPKNAKINTPHAVEFVESDGNTRCVMTDGQQFCASYRMRQPVPGWSFAGL
jgi:hypothetical protein